MAENKKKSYHGHRARLRQRFLDGPDIIPDYEILELLLGYVLIRRDTKPLAKELLQKFGSLRGVLDAKEGEIINIDGVGAGVQTFLKLLHETIARHAHGPLRDHEILSSPESVARMAKARLGRYSHEEVWAAYVDNNNRLLAWERLAKGSISMTAVQPRDIIEKALFFKATGFMLVHNHPAGSIQPSHADYSFTQQVRLASETMKIRFLDHIIVTDNETFSIMSNALL